MITVPLQDSSVSDCMCVCSGSPPGGGGVYCDVTVGLSLLYSQLSSRQQL